MKAAKGSTNPGIWVINSGVVVALHVAAGANTSTLTKYSAVTTTTTGKVMVQLANANGFGTGEFITINYDVICWNG